MQQVNVGVIGTGWCGGIRAVACSRNPLVRELHIAEVNPERLIEMSEMVLPDTATDDWEKLLDNADIDIVMISATPETTHYPMAKAALEAGKHVLLEKPISLFLNEADDLIETAERNDLKFTIAYSQRFQGKQSLIKRSLDAGELGEPVSVLVSRHITRGLGDRIGKRIKLTPASMEATHDIDFAMWCLEPRKPVRVYCQPAFGHRKDTVGLPDTQMMIITMDDGVVVCVGAGMSLPENYPHFSTTWIEFVGTEGSVFVDDSHRDIVLNTAEKGVMFPLSTMPGEYVGDHTYHGPMERETNHFVEAVAYDHDVMVQPRLARTTMEIYLAADLSSDNNQVIELPMDEDTLRQAHAASVKQ